MYEANDKHMHEGLVIESHGGVELLPAQEEQMEQDLRAGAREADLQTEGRIVAAVERDGLALRQVPLSARTAKVCQVAVGNCGMALGEVPESLRTENLCRAAVGNCGMALGEVPASLKTENLCLTAIGNDALAFCHVPPSAKTARVCWAAVEKDGINIKYVPKELRTEDICKAAVKQNGLALIWVPLSARTAEVCRAAVENCGLALSFVPGALKTRELCLAAVESGGEEALKFVPENLKTEDVCQAAAVAEERFASLEAGGGVAEDCMEALASPESILQNAEPAGTQAAFDWISKNSSIDRFYGPLDVQSAVLLAWTLAAGLTAAMGCKSVLEGATDQDHDEFVCGPVNEAVAALKLMSDVAARDAQAAGAPADEWQTSDHVKSISFSDAVRAAVASAVRPVGARAAWACEMLYYAAVDGAGQVLEDFSKWGGQEIPDGGMICEAVTRLLFDLADISSASGEPVLCFPWGGGVLPAVGAATWANSRAGICRTPRRAAMGSQGPRHAAPTAVEREPDDTTIHEDVAGVARTKDKEQDMNAEMNMQESFEAVNQSGMELPVAREVQAAQDLGGVREEGIPSASEAGPEDESREDAEMDPRKQPWDCEPYKTAEECMEAIGDDGGAELAMLPYEKRSAEVCLAAVKADKCGDYPGALFYVPGELKTADLCRAAVETRPDALEFVPEELKSLELCKLAVKGDPMAMGYAPGAYTNELIDFIKAEIPSYEEYGACILD